MSWTAQKLLCICIFGLNIFPCSTLKIAKIQFQGSNKQLIPYINLLGLPWWLIWQKIQSSLLKFLFIYLLFFFWKTLFFFFLKRKHKFIFEISILLSLCILIFRLKSFLYWICEIAYANYSGKCSSNFICKTFFLY